MPNVQIKELYDRLASYRVWVIPAVMWGLLCMSLQTFPDEVNSVAHPDGLIDFIKGIRSIIPIVIGSCALAFIAYRLFLRERPGHLVTNPLAFTVGYGFVGIASALLSPDGWVSIYWVILYLSVPLALLAISWGPEPSMMARRIVTLNWTIISCAMIVLFIFALIKMGLWGVITDPGEWANCRLPEPWLNSSKRVIRETGVGRYAAIAALIAFSQIWFSGRRPLKLAWGALMCMSLILLMTSGAKTSMVAMLPGLLFIGLLFGGKKMVAGGALLVIVMIPPFWFTDAHHQFMDVCLFNRAPVRDQELKDVTSRSTDIEPIGSELAARDVTPRSTDTEPIGSELAGLLTQAFNSIDEIDVATEEELPEIPDIGSEVAARDVTPRSTDIEPIGSEVAELLIQAFNSIDEIAAATEEELSEIPGIGPKIATRISSYFQVDANKAVIEKLIAPGEVVEGKVQVELFEPSVNGTINVPLLGEIPKAVYTLTGRIATWRAGWGIFKDSPILGFGFHADRLKLNTHMHNSIMHGLVQTGATGTILLMAGFILTWLLAFRGIKNLARYTGRHKLLLIQSIGILSFMSVRSITESTGAFFSVDWLLLAPLMLYFATTYPGTTDSDPAYLTGR